MRISVLTIFPEMFAPIQQSILGKAIEAEKLTIDLINIRDFSTHNNKNVDDYPFGGGSGMVMMIQPIADAMEYAMSLHNEKPLRIYMSPQGKVLSQKMVTETLSNKNMIILCGHYEGVDQRVIDNYIDMEVSIGDYVLTGGELPAMVLIDCVSRYIEGVLGNNESLIEESFSNGLLEYPQYTRPSDYKGMKVPEVLLSGHHKKIKEWQMEKSQSITKEKRPDLL